MSNALLPHAAAPPHTPKAHPSSPFSLPSSPLLLSLKSTRTGPAGSAVTAAIAKWGVTRHERSSTTSTAPARTPRAAGSAPSPSPRSTPAGSSSGTHPPAPPRSFARSPGSANLASLLYVAARICLVHACLVRFNLEPTAPLVLHHHHDDNVS